MSDESITAALITDKLIASGLDVSDAQSATLTEYVSLLEQWGRVYNLIARCTHEELIERHLLESLALGPLLHGRRVADVGTGAGLPGIPLAITEPTREFTLIESRAKRVRFLRHVIGVLDLGNTQVQHSRAEDLPTLPPFDTVLARAVAPPAELLQIMRPLTAPGSVLLLLTSAQLSGELIDLATDFLVRPTASAPRLRSSIVALERVAS